ncbi:MAG: TonB-dependent receptor plug domain-containing protein [Thermoanaerobaculia bacterium]
MSAVAAPLTPLSGTRYAGRPLAEALLDLRRQGLKIVFTSELVRPGTAVTEEPTATEPRRVLDQLLAPHGLLARDGPNGVVVVVPGNANTDDVRRSLPTVHEEMVVTPSRISLLREEPVAFFEFSREEILTLPRLGDDLFRSLTLLPGVTANDFSAQFHVRGGRRDETQVLLDGQELYEPFHLPDFDNALSVVAAETLSEADLMTGGFSAEYGDRMSGVLDMTTVTPSAGPRFRLGVGVPGGRAGASGALRDDRGAWIVEARRGSTDFVGRLLDAEDPSYWDAFGKLDYRLDAANSLRINVLHSGDRLAFEEADEGEEERLRTAYDSSYGWLTHQAVLSDRLYLESAGSWARIRQRRNGAENEDEVDFSVLDDRDTEVLGARQDWRLAATERHALEWGWQLRRFDTQYHYAGTARFHTPLAQIRGVTGETRTLFEGRFEEVHQSAYLADRMRLLEPLTVELSARYDRYSQTDEELVSPRLNLAYAVSDRGVVRVAWGRFGQSQRPYEMQVEDGETGFHRVEESEHRVLGFETILGGGFASPGLALRAEIYQREVLNPRPRYENLFEPINFFPEAAPDRVLIAPLRSVAEGVELFLRGHLGPKVTWWANYAYATTEDEIDGRWVPRLFDQKHSLNLDLDWELGRSWRLNLGWRIHTGWPTTPLTLGRVEDEEGKLAWVPVLGPLNGDRLPTYHRLDLRASRSWRWRELGLELFVEIQNAYDRQNTGGFEFDVDPVAGTLAREVEAWPGVVPAFGLSLEF